MVVVRKTSAFLDWLKSLRDVRAVARISVRVDRLSLERSELPGIAKAPSPALFPAAQGREITAPPRIPLPAKRGGVRGGARDGSNQKQNALGNPGDVRPVGEGVSEMRFDYGPGYRVYYVQRGSELVILLCGGDKSSQVADIARGRHLAKEV